MQRNQKKNYMKYLIQYDYHHKNNRKYYFTYNFLWTFPNN